MDYALVLSRANQGLDAPLVKVEVHLSNGLPAFTVVGMPETAVRESKDRVRSALINSHFEFPDRRITVNLAPADLPKGGGRFDLPIALGILCASGQLTESSLSGVEAIGELALDGSLRGSRGSIAATLAATARRRRMVLPLESASLCSAVPGAQLIAADHLLHLCAILRGREEPTELPASPTNYPATGNDLAEVTGQQLARRSLEIAAAGAHNLLLVGPPGTGKSLLASCLPGILPAPTDQDQLTALALHDIQGVSAQLSLPPFRAPHHSASATAIVGGGSIPKPGEISLAHGGVLFLDELPEFSRQTLDMLREPLETGEIHLARAQCRLTYPARFQLIAAMNPCPCGYAGDPDRACRCSEAQIRSYQQRVSGPLLDRIDMQIRVERESDWKWSNAGSNEPSVEVAARVAAARKRQLDRQGSLNAQLRSCELRAHCRVGQKAEAFLEAAAKSLHLSPRAIVRSLRVARTIADLRSEEHVGESAIAEAMSYRLAL